MNEELTTMPTLFISCPMNGRTDEAIKDSMEKMHKIAEIIFGRKLYPVDTFLEGADYTGKPLECLGESIKRMQYADYFIGVQDDWQFRGCHREREIFEAYKYKKGNMTFVDGMNLMPDAYEILEKRRRECVPVCNDSVEPLNVRSEG